MKEIDTRLWFLHPASCFLLLLECSWGRSHRSNAGSGRSLQLWIDSYCLPSVRLQRSCRRSKTAWKEITLLCCSCFSTIYTPTHTSFTCLWVEQLTWSCGSCWGRGRSWLRADSGTTAAPAACAALWPPAVQWCPDLYAAPAAPDLPASRRSLQGHCSTASALRSAQVLSECCRSNACAGKDVMPHLWRGDGKHMSSLIVVQIVVWSRKFLIIFLINRLRQYLHLRGWDIKTTMTKSTLEAILINFLSIKQSF